jgi:hypothetical protein
MQKELLEDQYRKMRERYDISLPVPGTVSEESN